MSNGLLLWHPASYARETSAGANNMYRDVEAAEEGGVDLKAKFEWKREQGRLCLWKGCRRSGRTGCDWALWAIEQRVVVLMCDFGEGGKEEHAGMIGLGGDRLPLVLKRPFMGLRKIWGGG